MSRASQFIPSFVVDAVIAFDIGLRCMERIVRGVVGKVEKERLVLFPGGGFVEEVEGEVGDGVRGVERTAVEGLGNLPLLAIEAE